MRLPLLSLTAAFLAMFSVSQAEPLKVGDPAPLVSGITETGAPLQFADVYAKNKYTLVYFYPKADTPGCTKQGCSLRDGFEALSKKGVEVIGVSTDDVEAQRAFKEKYHFPFTLIADTDKKVIKGFGQAGVKFATRESYLIKDGKIVYTDKGITEKQADNILAFLAKNAD